jgi:hypothetical protein
MKQAVTVLCVVLLVGCSDRGNVDASFYPNADNLTEAYVFKDVGSVENCRSVVREAARLVGNPTMSGTDYECCVDPTGRKIGSATVCKETVR